MKKFLTYVKWLPLVLVGVVAITWGFIYQKANKLGMGDEFNLTNNVSADVPPTLPPDSGGGDGGGGGGY